MTLPTFKTIPVRKIFIDTGPEAIYVSSEKYPRGERRKHAGTPGYQRDPWARIKWIESRVPHFSEELCRPIEVARRPDGFYAAIDGGGRWVLAQLIGRLGLMCRVHENLTRAQEARLFAEFDDTYKLRSIDTFVALIGSRDPMAMAIAAAARPYRIAARGSGTIKCVGSLVNMYIAYGKDYARGTQLIEYTCRIAARGWSGYAKDGRPNNVRIDGKFMSALAMLIDAKTTIDGIDTDVMQRVLVTNSPIKLQRRITTSYGDDVKTQAFTLHAAKRMASVYNRSFAGKPEYKITKEAIDNCSMWETIKQDRSFSAMRREAQLAARAATAA